TTNDGGKPGEVHLLVMLVWQKQGGKWILLARQAVKTV
ncbi:MAG: nuclear transport factor 2 family protein, partial [Bacteroidota bacterium]